MKRRGPPWITGQDPLHHEMYVAYGYKRQSCLRRGEGWHLTWPQYRDLWLPHWHQRGVQAQSLCLSRCDFEDTWHIDNVQFETRRDHSRRVRQTFGTKQ